MPSAGSRPGRRGTPGSRRRSSAGPRRPRSSGWAWLSRRSRRLTASSVRCRRCGGIESLPLGIVVDLRAARAARGRSAPAPRSRVRILPVTFSRTSRGVSRSPIVEVALEQIDHRQVAGGLAVGHGAASSTSQPSTRWEWVNSKVRRDLPTPGSPTTATTWPRPLRGLLRGPGGAARPRRRARRSARGRARRRPAAASAPR